MSETERTMLTDEQIQEAKEAYRRMGVERRKMESADPILVVVEGAMHYLGASRREADKLVADATQRAGQIIAEAEQKATAVEARILPAEREVKRLLDEGAMLAAEIGRQKGENQELKNEKATLVAAVGRLTKTVADLEAIR